MEHTGAAASFANYNTDPLPHVQLDLLAATQQLALVVQLQQREQQLLRKNRSCTQLALRWQHRIAQH